jgi:hypothetical protein
LAIMAIHMLQLRLCLAFSLHLLNLSYLIYLLLYLHCFSIYNISKRLEPPFRYLL